MEGDGVLPDYKYMSIYGAYAEEDPAIPVFSSTSLFFSPLCGPRPTPVD